MYQKLQSGFYLFLDCEQSKTVIFQLCGKGLCLKVFFIHSEQIRIFFYKLLPLHLGKQHTQPNFLRQLPLSINDKNQEMSTLNK